MGWFSRLFSRGQENVPTKARAPSGVAAGHDAPPAAATATKSGAPPQDAAVFLPWLTATQALVDTALSPKEQALLATLNALLRQPSLPEALLPRAAQLIPRLVALMREHELPVFMVAKKISRDPVLMAEVLHLANSPNYRAGEPIDRLEDAIAQIGHNGLNCCIAKVLFKPIVRDSASLLTAGLAQRLWDRADQLAERGASLAQHQHQRTLDGYLVGLLSTTGWNVALAAWRKAGLALPLAPSKAFASAADAATLRLFGHAAKAWDITEGFMAFSQDLYAHGLQQTHHPLATVLRQARHATETGVH
ncbi:HDOD domain-containing protein [Rhodoferax aquaticus]|uniref:HDOD domain-containing protein n=1 Tax=Rhodoferax aquaticus TaxID=2527691 RepID=A0A515EL23_9BURK|nr:HDOD domain-containing protein [Rhodoferax aquaticus]QDL53365.1 HDOD domain-containing protein [Rhodoferax aquaticus]